MTIHFYSPSRRVRIANVKMSAENGVDLRFRRIPIPIKTSVKHFVTYTRRALTVREIAKFEFCFTTRLDCDAFNFTFFKIGKPGETANNVYCALKKPTISESITTLYRGVTDKTIREHGASDISRESLCGDLIEEHSYAGVNLHRPSNFIRVVQSRDRRRSSMWSTRAIAEIVEKQIQGLSVKIAYRRQAYAPQKRDAGSLLCFRSVCEQLSRRRKMGRDIIGIGRLQLPFNSAPLFDSFLYLCVGSVGLAGVYQPAPRHRKERCDRTAKSNDCSCDRYALADAPGKLTVENPEQQESRDNRCDASARNGQSVPFSLIYGWIFWHLSACVGFLAHFSPKHLSFFPLAEYSEQEIGILGCAGVLE